MGLFKGKQNFWDKKSQENNDGSAKEWSVIGAMDEAVKKNGFNANGIYFSPSPGGTGGTVITPNWMFEDDEPKTEKEEDYVFWGLNGKLANHYSIVDNAPEAVGKIEMQENSKNIPYRVFGKKAFIAMESTLKQLGINLIVIDFGDALSKLRVDELIVEDTFEEPEEGFDDNCTSECRPGEHKCGK